MEPSRRIPLTSLRRAAKAARSGFKRYPRAIYESVRARGHHPHAPEAFPDLAAHPMAAVWLGHATVLLRMGGLNVLTDPVFSGRIGPSLGRVTFGLSRLSPFPVTPQSLPKIDVILLSHAHFDHLDKPTLRRLISKDTAVVTARRTGRLVPPGFGDVFEVDWEDEVKVGGLRVAALRPAHWGARTALDRGRGYNAYLLRADGQSTLFAGDTAYTKAFDSLKDVRLAVMGIGAYEPWTHAHATPEQAWTMFQACGARHLLPIHHSTFPLGDEHVDEPMQRLLAAAGDEGHRVIRAAPGTIWAA